MASNIKNRGFTLIELLVVIAIISILTGIIFPAVNPARGKARDAERISDLGHLQLALELYFDRCRGYPPLLNDAPTTCGSNTVHLTDFIDIPTPPGTLQTEYEYDVSANKKDYVLHAILESPNEVVKDGLPSNALNTACSNAANSVNYCVGPK